MGVQTADTDASVLAAVERVLTASFIMQVEACARQGAQTGNYMSEDYGRIWRAQQAQYVSPEHDESMAQVAALNDALHQDG